MKNQIIPGSISQKELHHYIISAVAPRPIAFVSTVDEKGVENLAPYSFFNAFSSNPPILVFSSNRKGTDNSTKDTLHNVEIGKECVINVVPHKILRQMALASVEFPSDVSEFGKTGLTPERSEMVSPPRVAESPVNMECKVVDIITLGTGGGAGHLVICEILLIAVDESVIVNNQIDQQQLDLMGRLGKNYYVRASGDAIMELYQSVSVMPLGFDRLPVHITNSKILTGNDIGALGALLALPTDENLFDFKEKHPEIASWSDNKKHQEAQKWIHEGHTEKALCLLLA